MQATTKTPVVCQRAKPTNHVPEDASRDRETCSEWSRQAANHLCVEPVSNERRQFFGSFSCQTTNRLQSLGRTITAPQTPGFAQSRITTKQHPSQFAPVAQIQQLLWLAVFADRELRVVSHSKAKLLNGEGLETSVSL